MKASDGKRQKNAPPFIPSVLSDSAVVLSTSNYPVSGYHSAFLDNPSVID